MDKMDQDFNPEDLADLPDFDSEDLDEGQKELWSTVKHYWELATDEDAEKALSVMEDLFEGKTTWAKINHIPKQVLIALSEQGYMHIQSQRFAEAEKIFRALSKIDHLNPYYHVAMGSIYQRQDRLFDALAEYTAALEIDPKEITALVNRGDIFYSNLGLKDEPLADFEAAIALDPKSEDPWGNRARFLKGKLEVEFGLKKA